MRFAISTLDLILGVARPVVFGLIAVVAALCTLDWAVRTRRVNPFGGLARFTRRTVDPLITPVERRIVRAGGTPASAPWWTLVAAVLAGFGLLALLTFIRGTLADIHYSVSAGGRGILVLLVSWTFTVLQLAILVRVITSWVGGAYSAVGRLATRLTEWLLRPLRQVIPTFGGIDVTPILAWFLLNILQGVVIGALR
jgi:YggT family protein